MSGSGDRLRRALALAALCAATTTCASAKRARNDSSRRMPPPRTVVSVDNQNYLDMTIYIAQPTRVRLGLAASGKTTTFVIPADIVNQGGSLRFVADPVGAPAQPITESITVLPGDEVILRLPPD